MCILVSTWRVKGCLSLLAFHKEDLLLKRLQGIYTSGQPRVGDVKFGEFMKEQLCCVWLGKIE